MSDHVVVGQQDEVSLPFQATFTAVVSTPTHYRYVRAIKTITEYFFIGELRVFAEPVSVPRVTVFEHGDYQGQRQTLEPGYHAGPLAVGNNAVSSVRVPPGYRVTLYEHGPGTGRQRVLTADAPMLPAFNDITSNILVERILQRWVFVQGMDSPRR